MQGEPPSAPPDLGRNPLTAGHSSPLRDPDRNALKRVRPLLVPQSKNTLEPTEPVANTALTQRPISKHQAGPPRSPELIASQRIEADVALQRTLDQRLHIDRALCERSQVQPRVAAHRLQPLTEIFA